VRIAPRAITGFPEVSVGDWVGNWVLGFSHHDVLFLILVYIVGRATRSGVS
jgi:hypothetical protein